MSGQRPILQVLHDASRDQAGCLSTAQLHDAGISDSRIASLQRRGALCRAAPGVYVVGAPTLSDEQLLWVAILVAGPNAVISHWTAAALHGIADGRPGVVWVTAPHRHHNRRVKTDLPVTSTGRKGIIHVVATRRATCGVRTHGLLATSVARILIDVAPRCSARELSRLWDEADYRGVLSTADLQAEVGRGVSGSRVVRGLLENATVLGTESGRAETSTEFLLARACVRAGLPRPAVNEWMRLPGARYRPDLWWHDARLVVEIDGGVHQRPARRRADALRDDHMRANGIQVLRIRDTDVEANADLCAARVGATLVSSVARNRSGGTELGDSRRAA